MKTLFKIVPLFILSLLIFTACSPEQGKTLEEMLKDPQEKEKALSIMADDHALTKSFIDNMIENNHATGMMVEGIVEAASQDSVLAGKISNMITKFPDLMLMTVHHFMPVINEDKHQCEGFCDYTMEHENIAETMCHKMEENQEMSCCQ